MGKTIIPLVASQDHKRVGEGDTGPNTGGMGAYCPAPVVDGNMKNIIQTEVLDNFLKGVQNESLYYCGIIYAGIMATKNGPKVLEFNVRFGDPEVQAVMALMESDLLDIILKTVDCKLDEVEIKWKLGASVCIVMASGGYPGSYQKGFSISGIPEAEKNGAIVFSRRNVTQRQSAGKLRRKRVLGVTATGKDIADALSHAYKAVDKIKWDGAFFRKDIAHKAIKRI